MTTRVLYLAAGNPIRPSVGMDLVIRQHLSELASDASIDLTAIAVAPGIPGSQDVGYFPVEKSGVHVFIGDLLHETHGLRRFWSKLNFILFREVPVMAYSFKSQDAQLRIRELLRSGNFDVVVVDHYYTLANVSLRAIRDSGAKLIYISHDAMLPHIAEMASMCQGVISKTYYYFEALRTHLVERRIFQDACLVVHLSEFERQRIRSNSAKHHALLPPIVGAHVDSHSESGRDYTRSVLFIGSPAHPPNAHAIEWILHKFSPAMAKHAPNLKIALIGGGTQNLQSEYGNVIGCGFVSNSELHNAFSSAIGAISPVVLGRGIKVKVLDAIAAGCPVWCTNESLRGFEAFGFNPNLDLGDPGGLAREVQALFDDPALRAEARARLGQAWSEFMSMRPGQLAKLVSTC